MRVSAEMAADTRKGQNYAGSNKMTHQADNLAQVYFANPFLGKVTNTIPVVTRELNGIKTAAASGLIRPAMQIATATAL